MTTINDTERNEVSCQKMELKALDKVYTMEYPVDLGLPSGTLWATCNLWAKSLSI